MPILNGPAEIMKLRKQLREWEQQAIETVKAAARLSLQEFMDRTPVWSGKTCGSYAWGVGQTPSISAYEGGPTDRGIQTGKMPLPDGEPNRPAAEANSMEQLEGELPALTALGLSLKMTNNSPIWDLVDAGSAPTPDRARNPGGTSVLAEQAIKIKLGDNFR